jgi:hypothetical protein
VALKGGANADLPQAAKVIFFIAAAGKGVHASVEPGGASGALFITNIKASALYLG